MTTKIFRFFEIAYLFIAIVFLYEAYEKWDVNRNKAYLFIFFVVVAIFMFFFKRKFRKKLEQRQKNN
ncbi:MAG: hypothetical protein JKZ03_01760 [Flavobacteriaceae bacterium]|nr:hypothetical protein [Flavobacteriaceae bacterium]